MNTPDLSDEQVHDVLIERFWISEAEIIELLKKEKETKFLSQYQWALSLFAEHMQDTKSKIIVTLDGRDTAGKW